MTREKHRCKTETPEDLLACAVRAARAAGDHAHREKKRRHELVSASAHDVKLRLDLECQLRAAEIIRTTYSHHRILGEEDTILSTGQRDRVSSPHQVEWIVDPIDGTVNFHHGLRHWCCSVAARQNGETLAAVVYAPDLEEIYTACLNGPALCNGKTLAVSRTGKLARALVLTGLDRGCCEAKRPFPIFEHIATHCRRARVLGAAALDICQVAAGRADGYFEAGIFLWDVAAAGLILNRAGGCTEVLLKGRGHRLWFLGTNGHIHVELRTLITRAVHTVHQAPTT
ncbi:MAG: hypothetical protein N2255_01870 [Kiritimatiellae bacterium]|nr:hypothetical protein [Kiritimatiellia bacterium]